MLGGRRCWGRERNGGDIYYRWRREGNAGGEGIMLRCLGRGNNVGGGLSTSMGRSSGERGKIMLVKGEMEWGRPEQLAFLG